MLHAVLRYLYFNNAKLPKIVPQAAAVVLGTTNAETFAIHRDHQTLVKYKSRNDAGFKKVSLCILLMVEEAPAKAIGNWERRRLVAGMVLGGPWLRRFMC